MTDVDWDDVLLNTGMPVGHEAAASGDRRVFVLDPERDVLARKALARYAEAASEAGHVGIAADLRKWLYEILKAEKGIAL